MLPRPPDRYCWQCGGALEVRRVRRNRVRGILGPRQWSADTVCTKCGNTGGQSWTTFAGRHAPLHWLGRLVYRLRHGRIGLRPPRAAFAPWQDPRGRVNFAVLVQSSRFPIYAIRSGPHGLRPLGGGFSRDGTGQLRRVTFGYRRGHPRVPDAAVSLSQSIDSPDPNFEPFHAAGSMLRSYASGPHGKNPWYAHGAFHRYWNVERANEGRTNRATVTLAGASLAAELTEWTDLPVALLRFRHEPLEFLVAGWRFQAEELARIVEDLVVLQDAPDVVRQHQSSHDEHWAAMMRRNDADHTREQATGGGN